MKIVAFEKSHFGAATQLALADYLAQTREVPSLPPMEAIPDLSPFAENGLGVAALDQGKLVGYLGCYTPWEHAFDSDAMGTFTPVHGHGAAQENRGRIYQALYETAADLWVKRGIAYHCIALYADDRPAVDALFSYGFGLRCVDAVRWMTEIPAPACPGVACRELSQADAPKIRALRKGLSEHLGQSPCFMRASEAGFSRWLARAESRDSRLFIAEKEGTIAAFLEVIGDGENFATEAPDMQNICGAYCLPAFRGTGVYQTLLNYVIATLKAQGVARLGVDYESFNPTAARFWSKYFQPYTNSLVRRIDECALRRG